MLSQLGFFRHSKPPSPLLLQPSKLLLKPRDNAVAANKDASDTPFGRDHRRKHVMAQHAQSLLEKDDNDTKYEAAHFISNTSEQRKYVNDDFTELLNFRLSVITIDL